MAHRTLQKTSKESKLRQRHPRGTRHKIFLLPGANISLWNSAIMSESVKLMSTSQRRTFEEELERELNFEVISKMRSTKASKARATLGSEPQAVEICDEAQDRSEAKASQARAQSCTRFLQRKEDRESNKAAPVSVLDVYQERPAGADPQQPTRQETKICFQDFFELDPSRSKQKRRGPQTSRKAKRPPQPGRARNRPIVLPSTPPSSPPDNFDWIWSTPET